MYQETLDEIQKKIDLLAREIISVAVAIEIKQITPIEIRDRLVSFEEVLIKLRKDTAKDLDDEIKKRRDN